MSTGPMLEHDPARAGSTADRGTQLGGVTRVLTGVLTFIFSVGVGLGRLLAGVLTIVLFPFVLLRGILIVVLRPLIPLGRAALRIAQKVARRLLPAAEWVGRQVARISHALLAAIAVILAPLVRGARRLLPLVLGFLTVILLPLVVLVRVLARIARVLWLVAAWVGEALMSFIQTLLLPIRAVLAPLIQACRRVGELLRRFRAWFAKLARRVAAPLIALLRRVREWMNRAEHSVLVASTKATFQATRSLQAPVAAPVGGASGPSADPQIPFQTAVYQNKYLPRGGVEVNAIVTVTAGGGDGSTLDGAQGAADRTEPVAPQAAEVIMLDCSGSMAYPLAKLREAQSATAAAIDSLRDGTWFALVRATERAELAYPPAGGLAQAYPETRRAAKRAVQLMWPEGGTAMGRWLTLARDLLASRPSAIAHAILLTDGSNESESRDALESALAECEGRFQCDCRGVGTDWRVRELRMIASRLLGTVDIVADPAGLQADFRSMIEQAMGKATSGVSLRLWTPQGATEAFLKQVSPTIEDLTDRANPIDALTADYPTGAWGDESRDYHLCVHVPAKEIGDELLAARVSMVVAGRVASQALIRAIWTDDEQLSTRINREVAHYTGQAELADSIQEGLEARKQGDEHTATFKLGRAVQLAAAAGNSDTMKLLARVVDTQEVHTGTVRLRHRVQDADEMALDTRSTKTVRVQGLGA
jgi:hypothetical protein